MKTFYLIYLFILFFSSAMTQEHSGNKIPDEKTERGTSIISAELVQLQFEAKNGKITDYTEWYVRRSVQDYFIKFCESGITRKELEKTLERQNSAIKSLTMEVEFKEGMWDKCSDELVQSRTGPYIIIHKILR
jgi:hypothetical protein